MKKPFYLKNQLTNYVGTLLIGLAITTLTSCSTDDELIDFESGDEVLSNQIADQIETEDYEMVHHVFGKDNKLIGELNNELEPIGDTSFQKQDDHSEVMAVVLYANTNFDGTKQVIHSGGQDLYLKNSRLHNNLKTSLTGIYVAPHCSIELYGKDNFQNKLATHHGSSTGKPKDYLGSHDNKTRSVIIKCDYSKAKDKFMGFVYTSTNYRGRAIPFFSVNRNFTPNNVVGYKHATISSISRNKYQYWKKDPKKVRKNIFISDPTRNGEVGIWGDENMDVPNLGYMNNRKLLLDPKTVDTKAAAIKKEIDKIRKTAAENRDKRIIVKDENELEQYCNTKMVQCENNNGTYARNAVLSLGIACKVAFNTSVTVIRTLPANTELLAAFRALRTGTTVATVVGALEAGIAYSNLLNGAVLTAGALSGLACIGATIATYEIANRPGCRGERDLCVSTRADGLIGIRGID